MKKFTSYYLYFVSLVLLLSILTNCSQESITIERIWADDDKVMVKLNGQVDLVEKVTAELQDAEDNQFDLYNSGANGDFSSQDSIWTYEFDTNYGAAPGNYYLNIFVYDQEGILVASRNNDDGYTDPNGAPILEIPED